VSPRSSYPKGIETNPNEAVLHRMALFSSLLALFQKISDKILVLSVVNTFKGRALRAFSPVAPALLGAHSMLRVTG
jgi:hypothetical protein